jgi:hypothetical protein
VQTAKDMGTPKVIVTSNQDAPTAQVTIWQTNTTIKKDLVMSNVSSVVENILRITRDVQPTKSYKKDSHLSVWNNTPFPHKLNIPYTLDQG